MDDTSLDEFEAEIALAAERRLQAAIRDHPYLAIKIRNGEPLNSDDIARIARARRVIDVDIT
jgi:hypothetical protein